MLLLALLCLAVVCYTCGEKKKKEKERECEEEGLDSVGINLIENNGDVNENLS